MRIRAVIAATTLLVAGTALGATTQFVASADDPATDHPVLIPITPCRLSDTRPAPNNVGGRTTPLGVADTQVIDAIDVGVPCDGLIPTEATALSLNVTGLNATTNTFLTIWGRGDRPLAANLNPAPGEPPTPNAVYVELDDDDTFQIYNDRGMVDVVVDVNGYYTGHDHDDRYLTEAEVDAELDEIHGRLLAAEREGAQLGFDSGAGSFEEVDDTVTDVATVSMESNATLGRRMVVATAVVHVNTSGDQESTWTLDVAANGGVPTTAVTRGMTVMTPDAGVTNPEDTITMMTSVIQEAGDVHTFSVSGLHQAGVPLANIIVELSVSSTYLDETTTPPGS